VLDPLVALAVALNIVWTAIRLLKRSTEGLMDASLSNEELDIFYPLNPN
jgi:divalent metal cation (Fe/Co/Zn/Cd) transporter